MSDTTNVNYAVSLHLGQIFDALSYYNDHRDEVERYISLNRVPVDD